MSKGHFTPYQLILGTLTIVYALRHLDDLLGIGPPEPLARMVSSHDPSIENLAR